MSKELSLPGRKRTVALTAALLVSVLGSVQAPAADRAMRFYSNGENGQDIDRVKIPLDDPHRPVDIGVGDFTIEWWMKATLTDNPTDPCSLGVNNWIYGNIFIDRDINTGGDWGKYGISLAGGRIAFGVDKNFSYQGLCGSTQIADDTWHHVAVTRRASDGRLQVYVDGNLDGEAATGPTGDLSYRDGRPLTNNGACPGPCVNEPFLVLGGEKHNYQWYTYNGFMDELRLSTVLRYNGNFTPPTAPFSPDASTAALYHFDEGSGTVLLDSSGAAGGPSHGFLLVGGNPAGPVWTEDQPFAATQIFSDGFETGTTSAWTTTVPDPDF